MLKKCACEVLKSVLKKCVSSESVLMLKVYVSSIEERVEKVHLEHNYYAGKEYIAC